MQNHVSLCHDAVARMDQNYWLFGNKKRLAAAEEALDQLAQDPSFEPAVRITRTLTADEQEAEKKIPLLREALVRMGAEGARQAAGSSSFLAGVALACGGGGRQGLDLVARSSKDPVAEHLAAHAAGNSGLEVLARERPQDPIALAGWVSGPETAKLNASSRVEFQRDLLPGLQSHPAYAVLERLQNEPILQAGLSEVARAGSTPLSVAATVLPLVAPEKRAGAEAEIRATLPQEFQSLAAAWLPKASSEAEKGALLRGLVEGAQRGDPNGLGALRTARSEGPLSPATATTALTALQSELKSHDFDELTRWCQQKKLSWEHVVAPAVDLMEGKLTLPDALRLASAERGDLLSEWLGQKASGAEPFQAAFLQSLALAAEQQDPAQPLQWILEAESSQPQDPAAALKACQGNLEKLPVATQQQVLARWEPLASTPELKDKLRLAASENEVLRQAGQAALATPSTALQVGLAAMRGRNDQAQIGRALESFMPAEWQGFASRLTAQSPDDAVTAQVYSYCLNQASQGKAFEPASYTPLLDSMLGRQVPDAVGDSLFLALRDVQDAPGKQRLEDWLQISRKLKLSGDAMARGALRLLKDPKLTPGLVASDTVASTRDPRSTLELLRWESDRAKRAKNPKQEAYLSAFVAGCEAAFTDKGRDQASLNALSYWKRVPEPKSLQEAVNQVNATVQSFGDTVQSQSGLSEALPLLKPFCQQPGEEPLLDLLIQESARHEFSDPTGQSAQIVRAAGYMDSARQSQGEPLAYLGSNMLTATQEDAGCIQRDVLQAIKRDAQAQGDKAREQVADFLLDLESWLPPDEVVKTHRAGLSLLSGRKYALQDLVKGMSWPSSTSRMAGLAKWGEIVSTSGTPLLRHQGSLLRKMADLPLETVDQRANAMHYAFHQIGTQTQADPMKQLWLMGQAAMGQAGNGSQCQRVAQLTCQELRGLSQDTAKTLEAEYFSVMDKVLGLNLPHTNDRYYLAQAFLALDAQKDPQDISRIGGFLYHAARNVQESSLPLVTGTLLDNLAAACKGWGDTKVLLPMLEKASLSLKADGSRNNVMKVAQELTNSLANYKENYWLVVSAQGGPRSEIEEKNDAVIVGGVRVAKNRTEGDGATPLPAATGDSQS